MTPACGRNNAQTNRGSSKREFIKRPGTSTSTIFNVWTTTDSEKRKEYKQISLRANMMMIDIWICQHSLCAQKCQVRGSFLLIVLVLCTELSEGLIQSTIWTWIAPQRVHFEKKQTWILHRHKWQFCKTLLDATFYFESFHFHLSKIYQYQTLSLV